MSAKSASLPQAIPGMSRARLMRIVKSGNALALGLGVWTIFWPYLYFPVLSLCAALPLCAIALDLRVKGALTFEESKHKAHRLSIVAITTMPALALFVRSLLDLNIPDHGPLTGGALVIALTVCGLFFRFDARTRSDWKQLLAVAIFALPYSFGSLAFANVLFDRSAGRETASTIERMRLRVSGGVKASAIWHEVRVDPAATPDGTRWVRLRPDLYDGFSVGERVCVHTGRGLFAVGWFDIRPCAGGQSTWSSHAKPYRQQ